MLARLNFQILYLLLFLAASLSCTARWKGKQPSEGSLLSAAVMNEVCAQETPLLQVLKTKFGKDQCKDLADDLSVVDYLDLSAVFKDKSVPVENIAVLKYFPNIVYLQLSNNQLSDLKFLQNITQLQGLIVDHNALSDLSSLTLNLRILDIAKNQVQSLAPLQKMTRLEVLWATDNQISDWEGLTTLPKLQYLSLDRNPLAASADFSTLKQAKWAFH